MPAPRRPHGPGPVGMLVLRLLAVMALLTVAACAPDEPEPTGIDLVSVGGNFGAHPQVTFDAPLDVTETDTEELITGEGTVLVDGAAVMVSFLALDAVTGEVIEDTFSAQPEVILLTEAEAGPLYEDLLGRTEGSRLLRVEVGTTTKPNPLVLVYDILHTRAWGEEVPAVAGMPVVTRSQTGEPTVTIPDSAAPVDLSVVPLIRGDGAQVRSGLAVTVRYTTVAWSTGAVVESTWGEGQAPTTVAFTGLIQGWQEGLVDETVGSQVMLVVPPEQAFGDDTLVYVIDVLAVSALTGTDGAGE
ncbi:FKBP-type peptidyl-prolyl cis-trans isomerase [Occultella gossypii]|uniref:Peptidyl-prolyl cis-trans isomerase n=1 Tax=Occultella gossypii TaxID=2800820 RepID=A0ABS7S2U8_9MICO|nr:FKBP-type peptidyl-prolyl cis-trans isomerase [Occultella gossypii]MBZ2194632.1 FKBP-type peptidyl-prolyl cis-trans isomerase [Occultella gossypii]